MASPFGGGGGSGGNDPDRLVAIVMVGDGMGHQQHHDAAYRADRLPTLFPAFDPIRVAESERIGENELGGLKADAVLAPVCLGLDRVPREPQRRDMTVTANM
jgi:hypothetical protein